jgi:hypothetical protein
LKVIEPTTHKNPSLEEFLSVARSEFSYLVSDFGYTELGSTRNPFEVRFQKDEIEICVEGINYGFAASVMLKCRGKLMPLWALARARDYSDEPPGGQLNQVRACAALLLQCGRDVIDGDMSAFNSEPSVLEIATAAAQTLIRRRLP